MKAKPIDVELMRSLLEYRPDVGGSCLVWKVDRCSGAGRVHVKAGTRAGTLHNGYWRLHIQGKQMLAHRLVWAIVTGEDPPCQVDHIHGHEVGNHIENLRLAVKNEIDNGQNRKLSKNNTSGYVGVTYNRRKGKYKAQIYCMGKEYFLGYFATPEEAYEAYLKAKKNLHLFQPTVRREQ